MGAVPFGQRSGGLVLPRVQRMDKRFLHRSHAPFAADAWASRGRLFPEPDSTTRSAFGRDRDRILHSAAFRRLKDKTQVFLFVEDDHYRTRLTHTLEVAQIARTIGRLLGLDEDLCEVLALGHDLGHTPFGHAGERALAAGMHRHGGFGHNAQTLRVVTAVERRYAAFDGLNLTWESLEGLVKHNGPLTGPAARGEPDRTVLAYDRRHDLWLDSFAGAEAQVAAIADDIAYDTHDLDDGLRAGLFSFEDLDGIAILEAPLAETRALGSLDRPRAANELVRRLIGVLVADVLEETGRRLAALGPRSADDVRRAGLPLVGFSEPIAVADRALKAFLMARMYRHPDVMAATARAEIIVGDLFAAYCADPMLLPLEWRAHLPAGEDGRARHVADFVAGMTDRYAGAEHGRLFDGGGFVR